MEEARLIGIQVGLEQARQQDASPVEHMLPTRQQPGILTPMSNRDSYSRVEPYRLQSGLLVEGAQHRGPIIQPTTAGQEFYNAQMQQGYMPPQNFYHA